VLEKGAALLPPRHCGPGPQSFAPLARANAGCAALLHLDFSTGASGDKLLGALLELAEQLGLANFTELQELCQELLPNVEICRQQVVRGGISATHITVAEKLARQRNWREIRALIEAASDKETLDDAVSTLALRVFEAIARAEATVHDKAIDEVHFHEVGAADSIIDIVGNAWLLGRLAPLAVYATPLVLGFGRVHCAHGELPVPAPATAALVFGLPVEAGPYPGEMTTPTGAALAAGFVTHWQPYPTMRPLALGYGAGSREVLGASNTLRALLGEPCSWGSADLDEVSTNTLSTNTLFGHCRLDPQSFMPLAREMPINATGSQPGGQPDSQPISAGGSRASGRPGGRSDDQPVGRSDAQPLLQNAALIECNIDHRTPEALAFVCEELLAAGTLDVWQEPITMKKGRLACKLSLLCLPSESQHLATLTLKLTGSLGVRIRSVQRLVLERESVSLKTPYGLVRYKHGHFIEDDATPPSQPNSAANKHKPLWIRPEHEEVARLARSNGQDYQQLADELTAIGQDWLLARLGKTS